MYDMLVVGGGINGVGIARDAAGRGLKVALCEQHDLAAHTSSASSKLVHGGLRYLEQRAFGMVRHALAERAVLLRLAPHIVTPLRVVLPHAPHLRPAWMIRLGLWLYDHLGGRDEVLPRSRALRLEHDPLGDALRVNIGSAFVYSDAQVPDARLVVLNALDAHERGAEIWTRTTCVAAERGEDHWTLRLRGPDEADRFVRARMLVNATGPWAARFCNGISLTPPPPLRLVQGSHIVVPRLFAHDHAYLLQQPDQRVVFVIPFDQATTLVGTTDVEFMDDPARSTPTASEVDYLCAAVNRSFRQRISRSDVLWMFSGVRPLIDEVGVPARAVTRDYRLELDGAGAPLLNVLGGKLTTYRRLAEQAVDSLLQGEPAAPSRWTADGPPLPGGDLGIPARVTAVLQEQAPWLPPSIATRWAASYGSRALRILHMARSLADLGLDFGAGLHEAEVRYLMAHEWARTADDVLWRRTRLGLAFDERQRRQLQQWLDSNVNGAVPGSPPPSRRDAFSSP